MGTFFRELNELFGHQLDFSNIYLSVCRARVCGLRAEGAVPPWCELCLSSVTGVIDDSVHTGREKIKFPVCFFRISFLD